MEHDTARAPAEPEQENRRASVRETTLGHVCMDREGIAADVLETVLTLAVELAREGREGHTVGTIFTVGDAEGVIERSRPLILDPLAGHPAGAKRIGDADVRETVKELALLDGGFIVANDGTTRSASRYFSASPEVIDLPLGLGSRHMAGASISLQTGAVAVVVSESSVVRLFDGGEIASEIIPELWMLRRHGSALLGESAAAPEATGGDGDPAVVLENTES